MKQLTKIILVDRSALTERALMLAFQPDYLLVDTSPKVDWRKMGLCQIFIP